MPDNDPSVYEKDTREMFRLISEGLNNTLWKMSQEISAVNTKVDSFHMELGELDKRVTNHLAHRLPPWVAMLFTAMGIAIGALASLVAF